MNKVVKLYFVVQTCVLASCFSTTRIVPDKPISGNLPAKPEHVNSSFSLPFELDISSLETLIDDKLPSGVITRGSGRDGNTNVILSKLSEIPQ